MLRALRTGAIAVAVARRASALEPAASSAAPAGTLTLSPRGFDGGLLQLDVGVSFAAPGSRLLVAFRCVLCARIIADNVLNASVPLQLVGGRHRRTIVLV
jgi:hypothetical protein